MQFNGIDEAVGTKIHHPSQAKGGRDSQVGNTPEIISSGV